MFSTVKKAKELAAALERAVAGQRMSVVYSDCLAAVAIAGGHANWRAVTRAGKALTSDADFQVRLAGLLGDCMDQADVRIIMDKIFGPRNKGIIPVRPIKVSGPVSIGAVLGTSASRELIDEINRTQNPFSSPETDGFREVREHFEKNILEPMRRADDELSLELERRRSKFAEKKFSVPKDSRQR
jgi:hypothetical protein